MESLIKKEKKLWSKYYKLEPDFLSTEIEIPEQVTENGKIKYNFDNKVKIEVNIPVNQSYTKKIAGISFKDVVLSSDDEGKTVNLVYEDDNKYDPDAIKIVYKGQTLGYCPQMASQQWTATKIRKVKELGYEVEAKILAVTGGLVELEKCKNFDEFIETFFDLYEDKFCKIIQMSKLVIEEPVKPKQGLLELENNKDKIKDYDKLYNQVNKEWDKYLEDVNNFYSEIKNDKLIKIKKAKTEYRNTFEKLYSLIQKNKFKEFEKETGIKTKSRGVLISFFIRENGTKTRKPRTKYKNLKYSTTRMKFYEE